VTSLDHDEIVEIFELPGRGRTCHAHRH
jgi:hypothetical protein